MDKRPPININGYPHKLHERFGYPMHQPVRGGEFVRSTKTVEEIEKAYEELEKRKNG